MSYRFVGPGRGVPGLPHEIKSKSILSKEQKSILDGALMAGTYEEVKTKSGSKSSGEEGEG